METLPRLTARSLAAAIRIAGAGQASSLPGKTVNKLFPGYLSAHASRLTEGLALVTGTNGKTTTANMAARILDDAGRDIVHNAEGANLLSGIATAFTRHPDARFALLEVDEAVAPLVSRRLRPPDVVVLTNLFRDQLDRYGEVDRLATGWLEMFRDTPGTRLVANADDPLVAHVALESGLPVVFFGVESAAADARHEVSDVTVCPRCAAMLEYDARWLSQLGEYRCPSCDFARPPRDLSADVGPLRAGAPIALHGLVEAPLDLLVPGLHNVYNALGALALALDLRVPTAGALHSLARYQPVFGRWSCVRRGLTTVRVNLAKNPAGLNQSLRTLHEVPGPRAIVLILNDNIADGRDISWIWDVDMEELLPEADLLVTTGTRRREMALRLKYAGVPAQRIETVDSLAAALRSLEARGHHAIYVLPTYTALKEVRRTLLDWETVAAGPLDPARSDGGAVEPAARTAVVTAGPEPGGRAIAPAQAAAAVIRAVHLYPTTMNTYGDRGNVAALTRRAQWRGMTVTWHDVEIGEPAPEHPDLIFMGGGQDRVQHSVADDLATRREWLTAAVADGAVLFAVCAGLQLLGRRYVAADGSELAGLGLLDMETVAARPGEWRLIGNVVIEVPTPDGPHLVAGFENHGGRTHLGAVRPLGHVLHGRGNNGRDGTEGARDGTVIATYLHGPALPKNAWLTDELLRLALRHAGHDTAPAPLDDAFEGAAQAEAVTAARREHAQRDNMCWRLLSHTPLRRGS
jgi:CobQ-like glutamine amidotransferase family enzyme/UDP-N-acetylmuramyl tripeptide synthase